MNRKGVEGLPLKYIIITIIAALIIGVLINTTTSIGDQVSNTTGMLVAKLQNYTNSLN